MTNAALKIVSPTHSGPTRKAREKAKQAPPQEVQIDNTTGSPETISAPTEAKPADKPAAAASPAAGTPSKKSSLPRRLVMGGLLAALLVAGGYYGNEWYQVGRFTVSTDDAYVKAEKSALSAQLGGLIVDAPVANNQQVHAGDTILKIDAGNYTLALDAAAGRIATQKSTIDRIGKQLEAQDARIAKAKTQVTLVESDLGFARSTLGRQSALARQRIAPIQNRDDAQSAVARLETQLLSANADLQSTILDRDVIAAEVTEARRMLDELQTASNRAARDLAMTEIKAPFDGIMSNRAVEVGQYVQPGQRVAFLVPNNQTYVEANFKETDLGRIHEGQDVTITVDALDSDIHGKVESISPASGAEFSLLPPENATGNFTKVVQRVPVRIAIDPQEQSKLRLGFSVTASINTKGNSGTSGAQAATPAASQTAN